MKGIKLFFTLLSLGGITIGAGFLLKFLLMVAFPLFSDVDINDVDMQRIIHSADPFTAALEYGELSIFDMVCLGLYPTSVRQFLRIDLPHMLLGSFGVGAMGFLSFFTSGGILRFTFGGSRRWKSGKGKWDTGIFAIVIAIGLVRAAWSLYGVVDRKCADLLKSAGEMIENVQD